MKGMGKEPLLPPPSLSYEVLMKEVQAWKDHHIKRSAMLEKEKELIGEGWKDEDEEGSSSSGHEL